MILLGDLNAEPSDPDLDALDDVPFSDPAMNLLYRRTHVSGGIWDYILLSPDADKYYVPGSIGIYRDEPASMASDHYPIYLDLRF